MRRIMRRSRSTRGPRRKLSWGDAFWGTSGATNVNAGNSAAFTNWIKVPAGIPASGNSLDWHEPEDQTLVRSYNRFGWAVYPGTNPINVIVAAGILVWEWQSGATTPSPLDVPLPVDLLDDSDWVWKIAFPAVAPNVPTFYASAFAESDLAYWSRAQRKLSKRAGLLLVTQCLNNLTGSSVNFWWNFYGRYLFKEP